MFLQEHNVYTELYIHNQSLSNRPGISHLPDL